MYCTNCGQKIPDNSRFCPKCGHKIDNPTVNNNQIRTVHHETEAGAESTVIGEKSQAESSFSLEEASGNNTSSEHDNSASTSNTHDSTKTKISVAPLSQKHSGKFIKFIPAVIICAIAVIVVVFVVANHRTTVDLSRYVSITFDGYDTIGTASYELDTSRFSDDYDGKIKLDKKAVQKAAKNAADNSALLSGLVGDTDNFSDSFSDYASSMDFSDYLLYMLDGTISPDENLSNGDTVTFTWNISEDDIQELETAFHCRIKTDNVTATVEGLEEVESFDPFDGVEVTYSGIAPNGRVDEISMGSDPICSNLVYSADTTNGLSDGDKVTVSVNVRYNYGGEDISKYCLEKYGKIPSTLSKDFTVAGLPSYIKSAADIPADLLSRMQSEAEDAFRASSASNWDYDVVTLTKIQYLGNYFLSAKSSETNPQNYCYLVYKVRAHISIANDENESYDNDIDYYWYCGFENLLLEEDGTASVDLTYYHIPENNYTEFTIDSGIDEGWGWTYTYTFSGYDNIDEMYSQLVTTKVNDYLQENNVQDVDFGSTNTSGKNASGSSGNGSANEQDSGTSNTNGMRTGNSKNIDGAESDEGDSSSNNNRDELSDNTSSETEILPESSDRTLTENDVAGLSDEDLQTAINEIYARHGYKFNDQNILNYFEQYDWYHPTIDSADFSLDILTSLERDNIDFLREHMG